MRIDDSTLDGLLSLTMLLRSASKFWRPRKQSLTTARVVMARPTRTARLYFDDTYAATCVATIVEAAKEERGPYFILDRTLLHPQGGGQPADNGHINIDGVSLAVTALEEDKENQQDGAVKHFVHLPEGSTLWSDSQALLGRECTVQLDLEARSLYAKLHSAGHVLANVVDSLYSSECNSGGMQRSDRGCSLPMVYVLQLQFWLQICQFWLEGK